MVAYRLFCLSDFSGRVQAAETIEAASDEDAIIQARALGKTVRCELWRGQCKIAVLEPEQAAD